MKRYEWFGGKTRELARSTLTATFFARLNRTAQRVLNITGSLRPLKIVHARAEARGAAVCAFLRRRHESSTAEAVTARKYRFRARTLSVMGVLLLASAVAAFTWSSTMWWTFGAVATVTLLYLAYLRRQTRIEEQLRRRRAQRIARSRLGVENTADPEFDVTPARLRRPGAAVLEIDDEDPEFEHLEHVAFARHYDLPRAAGQ